MNDGIIHLNILRIKKLSGRLQVDVSITTKYIVGFFKVDVSILCLTWRARKMVVEKIFLTMR
jgi:hypothetical protein